MQTYGGPEDIWTAKTQRAQKNAEAQRRRVQEAGDTKRYR